MVDIGREIKLFVRIRDILDEITIILHILSVQEAVLRGSTFADSEPSAHYEEACRIVEVSLADFRRKREHAEAVKINVSHISPIDLYCWRQLSFA